MLRGLFGAKQKREGKPPDPFRTVLASPWTIEYRGALPATEPFGIRHSLICAEITPVAARALLEQGFKPINSDRLPDYAIKCTSSMGKDSYQPRALFDLYISLEKVSSLAWRQWIAVQTCQGLKKRLLTCTEKALLIRCHNSQEFPFCMEDNDLDFSWLDDGNRYLRSALLEYESVRQV